MTSRVQEKSQTAEVVRKFEWTSTPGYIKADSITAKWEDGAWTIDASYGSSSQPPYQRFHLRLPSAGENQPIKYTYISDIPVEKGPDPVRESGFDYEYSWNETDQYGDVVYTSTGCGGYVDVTYNPTIKKFEGSFHYASPRQSNYYKEGDGTFEFALQRPTV